MLSALLFQLGLPRPMDYICLHRPLTISGAGG
jgi:hypothetical protein